LIILNSSFAQDLASIYIPNNAEDVQSFNNKTNAIYQLDSTFKWIKYSAQGSWFLLTKDYVLYDKSGLDTALIFQASSGASIKNSIKLTKRFKNNLLDTLYRYQWENEIWAPLSYTIYEYINAKIIRSKTFDWDGIQWLEVIKSEYYYDNKSNVTTLNIYGLAQSDLVLKLRKTYTYDFRNNITSITTEQINNTTLENFTKEIRSINESNNTTTSVLIQKWIKNTSKWQNDILVKNKFNGTILLNDSILKYQGTTLIDSGRNDYSFNANKKLLTRTEYIYFSGAHKKAHFSKNVYDSNNNLLTSNFSQYMLNDGALINADSIKYFYTNNTSIGINNNYSALNIYPNPAKNLIYFDLNETDLIINIFDSFGKLILQSSNNEMINIQNLTNGLYHVSINTKQGKSYRSKFIKE
ncbi:MAG: T9SS type A sorting domain-containing protein, partial [bacterium]